MIVIGVDVHKHSLTAVAVDELGRERGAWSGPVGMGLLVWARSVGEERLWAVEDCRHVTRGLERSLVGESERLVRVPPRLTAPQRRRGRTRGKSDRIDALAVARAALQEPLLDGPRAGEETLHELTLLVDHRDDLVAERRRCQQRLRWHLHELDPTLAVPLGALDRAVWIDRLGRQLRWTGWGGGAATAYGLTWVSRPNGGYFAKPGTIEMRAYRLGQCTAGGPPAYARLSVCVARPGGALEHWYAWGGWHTTCRFPS